MYRSIKRTTALGERHPLMAFVVLQIEPMNETDNVVKYVFH